MRINSISLNNHQFIEYKSKNGLLKQNSSAKNNGEITNVFYPHPSFLGKHKAKTKPENVIKALNSALKYNQKEKAAEIMADFYLSQGGYQDIINKPELEFQEFDDNITNNAYTHKYTFKNHRELFLKEGSMAYRQDEKIYETQIEKGLKPSLKEFSNSSILFYDLCTKASSELQDESSEKSAKTLQNFWIEYGGYQNIKKLMGKKARPSKSSKDKSEYYLKTKNGVLLISKDKIGVQCTRKDIQTNRYSKIMVEMDKNNEILCYRAENFTNMGIGIYDSIYY